MKILHFINSLSSGGAEVFLVDLLVELKKQGNDVSLATYAGVLDSKGENLLAILKQNDIPYFDLNSKTILKKITLPLKLNELIDREKFNIIHSHLDQSDFFLFLSSLIHRRKAELLYLRTLHSVNFIKRIPKFIHNKMMRFFKVNICVAENQLFKFEKEYAGCNFLQISNGISNKSIVRNMQTLVEQKFNIAFVGSFDKRLGKFMKGQDYALKVFRKVNKDNIILNFFGDGESMDGLIQYAKLKNIQNVKFHGQVAELNKEISKCNFFLSCSEFEGLPISVIEASFSGLIKILPNNEEFKAFKSKSTIFYNRENPYELLEILNNLDQIFSNLNNQAVIDIEYFQGKFNIQHTAQRYKESYS